MKNMFGVPLRALRKTNGSVHRQKAGLTMSNSPSAQTISLSALKSLPGPATFPNRPPKSPRPHPPSPQKGTCNRVLFSALFIWEDSNNIATVTKARPEGFTNGNTSKPRRFAVFQACFALLSFRQKEHRKRSGCLDESFRMWGCVWHVTLEESAGTS